MIVLDKLLYNVYLFRLAMCRDKVYYYVSLFTEQFELDTSLRAG